MKKAKKSGPKAKKSGQGAKKSESDRSQQVYICKEYKTTHAAGGIANLAALRASESSGPAERIPMFVTVSCGRPTIQCGDREFTLSVRNILIRSTLRNATIDSIRRVVISEGTVDLFSRFESHTIDKRQSELGMNLGVNIPSSVFAKGFFGLHFGKRRTASGTERSVATSRPRITLIDGFGADNMILIGDADYGDPYYPPLNLLKHEYPRDKKYTEPLLVVRLKNSERAAYVTLMTTVQRDRLFVSADPVPDRVFSVLEKAGHEAIREHQATLQQLDDLPDHEQLRRQMMGDEIFRRAVKNQQDAGLSVGVGEIAIMMATFEIKRAEGRMN